MERQNNKETGRRKFLKNCRIGGGLSLGTLAMSPYEKQLDHLTSNINRNSSPTNLRITDMRIAEISGLIFRTPIVRIDTNQGISGYGIEKPLVQEGYIHVPEGPGLGADPNYDMLEQYLIEGEELFAPTPEWDEFRSWDRIWS